MQRHLIVCSLNVLMTAKLDHAAAENERRIAVMSLAVLYAALLAAMAGSTVDWVTVHRKYEIPSNYLCNVTTAGVAVICD